MVSDPFKEYLRHLEPSQKEKGYVWQTAIGLQQVDGLVPSAYLQETAMEHIAGSISLPEVAARIEQYYQAKPVQAERTEEADKVSVRIATLLAEPAFSFNAHQYLAIHKTLFTGIYPHAGKLRDYNISKKEWGLDGASVTYGMAFELQATLEYDLAQEKKFRYQGISLDDTIAHLAQFVARLWQIHPFGEGNTRTTAVFFIQYLRTLGFQASNDTFAEHSWYFRNALVRANYNNLAQGVYATDEFLVKFLRHLLLNEPHQFHNRDLHIHAN